jgi:hypothetical protein
LAQQCNFDATFAAAKFLYNEKIYQQPVGPNVEARCAERLKLKCEGLHHVLNHEGTKTTAILTDIEPPDEITALTTFMGLSLQPHQDALRLDLITCLRAHLSRPAIVMAWALGYDLIRSWVFNDPRRLSDFNAQLRNPQVVGYHDFFAIGEQRVLETCRDAVGAMATFTSKTFRTLHGMLDDRNNFAHANYVQATPEEATVYVQRIVRVVTSPPFE